MAKWQITDKRKGYLTKELAIDRGFGRKTRGEIHILKVTGYTKPRYGVIGKLYDTKQIGLTKGDEGLTKEHRYRVYNYAKRETAIRKANALQKEFNKIAGVR